MRLRFVVRRILADRNAIPEPRSAIDAGSGTAVIDAGSGTACALFE
jgi:hypothetical protein